MCETILFFDDELAQMYSKLFGFTTKHLWLPYSDAHKCMAALEGGIKFNLFLTDLASKESKELTLPYISGDDLAMKVCELHPRIPIITISGYDYKPLYSRFHIAKPAQPNEIAAIVERFL